MRGRKRQIKAWDEAFKRKRVALYYFVEEHARTKPNEEAIWSRAGCYTWKEIYDRANQYAQWYLSQGIKPGDLVGFFMINSPDFVTAWIGLWAIGAAPALINFNLPNQALIHCLNISTAKMVLVDGSADIKARMAAVQPELEANGFRIFQLDDIRKEVYHLDARRPGDELRDDTQAGSPMGLFFTSGTTGMPKACCLPVIAAFGHAMGTKLGTNHVYGKNNRYYVCMPYYHGTGGINVMGQMLNGITVCVAPKFSASGFWRDVRDSRATVFVYVGETLRYLLAAPESPVDKKHNVHTIYGNGLRPDVWKRFRDRFGIERVFEFFNSTEGMFPLDNPARGDFFAHAVGHHGALLRREYHDLYIPVEVDSETGDIARDPETGKGIRVPYSTGGEILVRVPGPRVFPGYWNNPEATEKKFVRNLFVEGDSFYRTGDALRRDDDGRWYFMDRLGDTFRWKGENVSTAEVSEVLGKYPGVMEANVYGVSLPGHDGKAGAAALFIEPSQRSTFNHADFLSYARKHLPKYAVPIFLRHITEVTATHNNKQNKVPLKREGVDPDKVEKGDQIVWVKGNTYVPFTRQDWDSLSAGKAKL